jgi:phytoene dehydrogenase-like protein
MAYQTVEPPDAAVTGRLAYAICAGRQRWSWTTPKGGSGALTQALARFIEAHGGVILTNKTVTRLLLENGKCVGVECSDGSSYRAEKAVLSTIHIKHLVDMAPKEAFGDDFLEGVETWKAGITLFVTHYASKEAPKFPVAGGTISPVASGTMATPERGLRISYDFACGAVNVEDPPLLIVCSTVADPSRAPEGMHTIKVIGNQPYELKEGPGHWDKIKDEVSDANLKYLRRFAPNLTDDKILARIVESPLDLERMNAHNWHGTCHGGAQNAAQTGGLRPVPGWAQHRMPITGLYQTGATTYPGGSVSGGPGRNAAAVMLKDFGSSLEEVVKAKS